MFQDANSEKSSWNGIWPVAVGAVAIALLAIQIFRVNQQTPSAPERRIYTTAGPLITGPVVIRANDFYSSRIDLNRRTKLSGSFETGSVRSRISVLVLNESNFDSWNAAQSNYRALRETGYVPAGKISLVLEPGVYFLIIDNRESGDARSVSADFVLE
jgi:hypothetical protein